MSKNSYETIGKGEAPISVSVIVPVFRGRELLQKLLDSLLNQTLRSLEFIFVDDCGNDGTFDLVLEAAEKDKRIVCLRNRHNTGPGPCRNWGIRVARGEYIAFADADDLMAADFYEKLYTTAVTENKEAVKGRIAYIFNDGHLESGGLNRTIAKRVREDIPLYHLCSWEHQSWIFSKSLVERSGAKNADSRLGEDATFMLMVLYNLPKEQFALQNEACYYYRKHPGSLSATMTHRELVEIEKSHREKMEFLMRQPYTEWLDTYASWQFESRMSGMLCGGLVRHTVTDDQALQHLQLMRDILDAFCKIHPLRQAKEVTRKMLQGSSNSSILQYLKEHAERLDVTNHTTAHITDITLQPREKTTTVEIGIIAQAHESAPTLALLGSIVRSSAPQTQHRIHVFALSWEGFWMDCLMQLNRDLPQTDIVIHTDVCTIPQQNGSPAVTAELALAAALRARLPHLLPQVDKLLLLSPACLVQKDLASLYQMDVSEVYLAAVQDCPQSWQEAKAPDADTLISTSAMLLNLKRFREIPSDAPELVPSATDDSLFSLYRIRLAAEKMLLLHPRYNCGIPRAAGHPTVCLMANRLYGTHYCSCEEVAYDAVILDFSGLDEHAPWADSASLYRSLWMRAYEATPAADVPLPCYNYARIQDKLQPNSPPNSRLATLVERHSLISFYKNLRGRYYRLKLQILFASSVKRRNLKTRKAELKNLLREIRAVLEEK